MVESLFNGPVFRYRNTDIRFALPHDGKHLTPPHQDHFYVRQTDQFCTAWVPLMPIGLDGGVLAIAENSHKWDYLSMLSTKLRIPISFAEENSAGFLQTRSLALGLQPNMRPVTSFYSTA